MDTIVLSDLHLSDAEVPNPKLPLWKKFKQEQFFIDKDFHEFIKKIILEIPDDGCELILNGDIIDFDSVMSIPKEKTKYTISNYEKETGLNPMEDKSLFKIKTVLNQHSVFVRALTLFLESNVNNKIIFIIGNHDLELNWIKVQEEISNRIINKKNSNKIIFCEWFYISNKDTLIEHGHQYDPYCQAINPINPLIKKNGLFKMRLPFGNLANRFLINKMGFKNPHNDESYRKSLFEFIVFFIKYELKYQPLMVLTWFFGSIRTLIYSIGESFLPSIKDPLTLRTKIQEIANKSNASIDQVFLLQQNHSHPAVRKPWIIMRELWLDRTFIAFGILFICWQIFTTSYLFTNVSHSWFWVPLLALQPFLFYYAHNITSDIQANQDLAFIKIPESARSCNVKRVVLGHTHKAQHKLLQELEYINTGTWSVFFEDLECTQKIYKFTFAWIKEGENSKRDSYLYLWDKNNYTLSKESQSFIREYKS
jgi:UDP-2,3-diacylglucosamine pyrophosphatase LpxH